MTAAAVARSELLGVSVDLFTMDQLTDLVADTIQAGTRRVLANHNLHSVYLFHRHAEMRAMYAAASHTFIDGMSLVAAGKLLGLPVHRDNRIAALDWIHPLMTRAAEEGWRVFILAGEPGVARRGAEALTRAHPTLVTDTASGYFDTWEGGSDNEWMVERINRFRPELLLVGMGMPRQEAWIAANHERLAANIVLQVGALMDYIVGDIPTAPRWTGRLGIEWLFRLFTTPTRTARRYLLEPWYLVPVLLRDLVHRRRLARAAARAARPTPAVIRELGVSVDLLTMDGLTDLVAATIRTGARRVLANHNLHSVYLYHRHPEMRAMYAAASHTFIEGMSLVAAGKLLGLPVQRAHRIAVLDWIHPLMARAVAERWRVFILAGQPGVARRGGEVLKEAHPGLVVETASGFFDIHQGGADNEWMVERINRFGPHLLLVGMGMPRQEVWIAANHQRLDANIVLNVGGLMDCLAGEIPTAPRWLGRYGLEWLFRLVVTPRRTAGRYLLEPWTLLPMFWRDLTHRPRGTATAARVGDPS